MSVLMYDMAHMRMFYGHYISMFYGKIYKKKLHFLNFNVPVTKFWSKHILHPSHHSKTIMVGKTYAKLHATVLDLKLYDGLEKGRCKEKGETRFGDDYQTRDHTFTLLAFVDKTPLQSAFVGSKKALIQLPTINDFTSY